MTDSTDRPAQQGAPRRPGRLIDPVHNAGDAIANALAERVMAGALAPNEQLPSERRLAEEFGVSRPMVREALRSLVERGVIRVEPSRGAFVNADSRSRGFRPLDLEYRRRGTTARQLSEARIMLETEAVALATEHARDEDIELLQAAVERLERSATPLERVRNDLAFHTALVAASHNPMIETMFASIQALTVELMVRSAGDPEVVRRSAPHHRLAYEAVRALDREAARAAIHAHLSIAESTYGDEYDQSLDTTAARALRMIGSGAGVDEFLRSVLEEG